MPTDTAVPGRVTTRRTADGRVLVDADGDRLELTGVNVAYKHPPYVPPRDTFGPSDAERIASWGCNAVRLAIHWEGVMPRPGRIDPSYLDRVHDIVATCRDHGLYTVLDMHQDLYGPAVGGEGAPAWTVPARFRRSAAPWYLRYLSPNVAAAFDRLWLGRAGIDDLFAAAWEAVVDRFAGEPGIAGYDLFNEPMPGFRTLPRFERRHLSRFYRRVIDAVRSVDRETPVLVEPAGLFDLGMPSRLAVDDPHLGFSFHCYAPGPLRRLVFGNARRAARRLDAVPLLTEFGAVDRPASVRRTIEAAGETGTGWLYWAYRSWDDPTGRPHEALVREDGTLSPNVDVIADDH